MVLYIPAVTIIATYTEFASQTGLSGYDQCSMYVYQLFKRSHM